MYDKNLISFMRAIDLDLISLKDTEEEFINNCGFVKVKQLLVKGPSGKLYLVEGDEGIRTLQYLLNEEFRIVHLFVVDDFEEVVAAPNIIHHSEPYYVECEYETDGEAESDDSLVDPGSDIDGYNFNELELIKIQKSMEVNDKFSHYKELHMTMTFKT
ncbi:hypothetical protein RND71_005397 [Anisodus tanguticus]|uniref:Uncharacterized protein n=1 Tax=Anisodus tanguticus TaxID=243964 RepID=A0AAE1SRX9_9SOLA|nr:hypothetical protein RND71_005397 [Anisodus tanguticus]